MAAVSDGAMSRILGEQEKQLAAMPESHRRRRPIQIVDVSTAGPSDVGISGISTPVKIALPMYSQRKSCLLELFAECDLDSRKKRVEFESGDDDTPPTKRCLVADAMRCEGRSVPETGRLGLSDIESLARVLTGQANFPRVGSAVHSVHEKMFSEFRCSNEAGMGAQRNEY